MHLRNEPVHALDTESTFEEEVHIYVQEADGGHSKKDYGIKLQPAIIWVRVKRLKLKI